MVIFEDWRRVIRDLRIVRKIQSRTLELAPPVIRASNSNIDFFAIVLLDIADIESARFPVETIAERIAQSISINFRVDSRDLRIVTRDIAGRNGVAVLSGVPRGLIGGYIHPQNFP